MSPKNGNRVVDSVLTVECFKVSVIIDAVCGCSGRLCTLKVSGNTLQQVESFKYLVVVFTSGRRRKREIDTRIGKANTVLRELVLLAGDKTGAFKHRKAVST